MTIDAKALLEGTTPERLMREFYVSQFYDPKARPADNVTAAIRFATVHLTEQLAEVQAEREYLRVAAPDAFAMLECRRADLAQTRALLKDSTQ